MPASYTSYLPSLTSIQPAELRRKGVIIYLARHPIGHGHLLHSTLTCPSNENARDLKSRRPFVPAAQQLISSADGNNRSAVECESTTRLRTFIPNPPSWNVPAKSSLGLAQPPAPPHQFRRIPLLFAQMGYGRSCDLWCRTDRWPCCPSISNPPTFPWIAWPDVSGWWNNRFAAQHLPRDRMRPSSARKNWRKRWKSFCQLVLA